MKVIPLRYTARLVEVGLVGGSECLRRRTNTWKLHRQQTSSSNELNSHTLEIVCCNYSGTS
jgi:hypothetical protein